MQYFLLLPVLFVRQQPSITTFLKEGAPVEVIPGMFTTYRSDKHIYWEIPDSLIGREFAVTTTILDCSRPSRTGIWKKTFGIRVI